jgi:hypothetical protein
MRGEKTMGRASGSARLVSETPSEMYLTGIYVGAMEPAHHKPNAASGTIC